PWPERRVDKDGLVVKGIGIARAGWYPFPLEGTNECGLGFPGKRLPVVAEDEEVSRMRGHPRVALEGLYPLRVRQSLVQVQEILFPSLPLALVARKLRKEHGRLKLGHPGVAP